MLSPVTLSAVPPNCFALRYDAKKVAADKEAAKAKASAAAAAAAAAPVKAKPPLAGAAKNSFDTEAAKLTKEIEVQLNKASGGGATSGASGGKRPALSRMKKADLVAECEERKLISEGSVAELRAQLRVERKRDGLVAELTERGWGERKVRAALASAGWDVDEALQSLIGT